ncbi:MAG: CoA-binding protein [Dermatophilaceae bacterium]
MTAENDPEVIRDLLTRPNTWAVVGLSQNRSRTAYRVAGFLHTELGKHVVPVHPAAVPVFDSPGYRTLADIPNHVRVDVVDCFVNSQRVGAIVDDAIAHKDRLHITAVWLQVGVIDQAAADRARTAGLDVVMDRCPMIEHPRLSPAS